MGNLLLRLEVSLMTFNALGVNMKGLKKTLAETLNIEMPEGPEAKELKAEVKNTENLKEIVVELSNAKLADKDKLEDDQNYKVAGFVVKSAKLEGNNVIVLLEEALVKGRTYDLTIRNIDKAINAKYSFKAEDNTLPVVEEVTVLGEYGIKVTTSEPIKDAKERNFLVDGRNVSMKIEQYGRDIILTPYYNASFSANAKTLTIRELEDFAGYKSVEKDFDIKIEKDNNAPKVEDIISRGNVVEVTFDKDIYDGSVGAYEGRTSLGNISYQEGRQTIYAQKAEKVATNKVKYTFEKELPRRTSVTITDVANHSKVKMDRITQEPRLVLDYSEPEIIKKDVETTATTATITLKFDKAVEGNFVDEKDLTKGFKVANHFTLFERDVYRGQEAKGITMTAEYDVDSKNELVKDTVIVKLTGLTEYDKKANDLNYVLEVENFTDATSLRNKMYRDYVDFKATTKTGFFVKGVEVDKYAKTTEIKIELSKAVDKNIAEEHTNYLFEDNKGNIKDVKDLKGEVYAEKDGKVITIILPEDKFKVAEFKELTILNTLKDKDGNRLDKTVVYNFLTGATDDTVATIEEQLSVLVAEASKAKYNSDAKVQAALGLPRTTLAEKQKAIKALDEAIKAANVSSDITTKKSELNTLITNSTQSTYTTVEEKQLEIVIMEANLVFNDAKATLVQLNSMIEKLNEANNKAKASDVKAKIDALPAVADLVLATDETTVIAARTAHTGLTPEQKVLVTNLAKLEAAEAKILDLKNLVTAKTNVEGMTLTAVANADVNTEATAKDHVEALIDNLDLKGATSKVIRTVFTPAVATSSNGSYKFVVELTLNGADVTTTELELVINQ